MLLWHYLVFATHELQDPCSVTAGQAPQRAVGVPLFCVCVCVWLCVWLCVAVCVCVCVWLWLRSHAQMWSHTCWLLSRSSQRATCGTNQPPVSIAHETLY